MQRQVTAICPETGRTIWTYVDLGPGAAKPALERGSTYHQKGAPVGGVVAPKISKTPRTI